MSAAQRAYLPVEREQLGYLHSNGAIAAGALAHFVTDALRSSSPSSDEEGLEFIALQQATRHAIAAGHPVIVAAVDLPYSAVDTSADVPFVVTAPVPASDVVSFHLSDTALDGLAGDRLEPDEELDDKEAVELSWFDITELPQILR
ncbi:MAG: hypothetical protein WBB15_15725 [Ornithinimicrobium sp.]